jgi:hypothetical protein
MSQAARHSIALSLLLASSAVCLVGCERAYPTSIANSTGDAVLLTITLDPPHKVSGGILDLFVRPTFYRSTTGSLEAGATLLEPDPPGNVSKISYTNPKGIHCSLDHAQIERLMKKERYGVTTIVVPPCAPR